MKRLLILKTGRTAPEVQAVHGDYDRWFIDAINRPDIHYDVRDVTREQIPSLASSLGGAGTPAAGGYHGVLVTGSVSAAYRSEPWMPRLAEFLKDGHAGGRPVLCVCFGAQLLARACGGEVILNPRGWEIGSTLVRQTAAARQDPLLAGLPADFRVLSTHEDCIETLPRGCALLAGNDNSTVQAFRAAEQVWGVQFHPEATAAIIRILIELRAKSLERDAVAHGLPAEGHVARLLDTLDSPDVDQGRRILQNFVRICLAE